MFEWLFRQDNNRDVKDLIEVLKNGITINVNVNISGDNLDEQERRDSLEPKSHRSTIDDYQTEVRENSRRERETKSPDPIPSFTKLKAPQVNFGEEAES